MKDSDKAAVGRPRNKGGRPRAYDPEATLETATALLWERGLANCSLDEIARAAGINRPSLNAGFGDKRAIYLKAAARFAEMLRDRLAEALAAPDLQDAIRRALICVLDIYSPSADPERAMGCFIFCTAPAETSDRVVRQMLHQAVQDLDSLYIDRVTNAQESGELSAKCNAKALGKMLAACQQSLAMRARSGVNRKELATYVDDVIALLDHFK